MATDHRGRDVHAGKRTLDERHLWMVDITLPKGYEMGGYEMGITPSQRFNDNDFLADLGRGKMAEYEFNDDEAANIGEEYGGGLRVTGETRTPGRAGIAAEAMAKRIYERRNLRTGRPTT